MSDRLAAVTRPFRPTGVPPRRLAVAVAGLVGVEVLLIAGWLWYSPRAVTDPRYLVYPFLWIDASLLAVTMVLGARRGGGASPRRASNARDSTGETARDRRLRQLSLLVGIGYALLLSWAGGLIALGDGSGTLRLLSAPPGWGPILLYDGPVRLTVVPFKLLGYLALAWLVGRVVAAAGRPVVSGTLGLVTCVGCTGPLVLALATAVGGGSATAYAAVSGLSYDLSTGIFLVSLLGVTWSALRRP